MPPPSSSAGTRSDDDDFDNNGLEVEREIEEEECDNNDADVEEDEEEYEEIEVEEYEEIIEEIEVEEDEDEEEEEEEEPLDSSIQVDKKPNDVSHCTEFEGDDIQLKSDSTLQKFEPRLPSNSILEDSVGNSKFCNPAYEPLVAQGESYINYDQPNCTESEQHLTVNGEIGIQDSEVKKVFDTHTVKTESKELDELHSGSNSFLCNTAVMAAETTSPIGITENEVVNASCVKDNLNMKSKGILTANNEVKPTERQSENDKKQTPSRTRSLSPSSEFKDPNKHPALICDFFAKGWCIRGSSCRFLHVMDKGCCAKELLNGDPAATNLSKGDQLNEGLSNTVQKPKMPNFPDLVASPAAARSETAFSRHFSSERILPLETGGTRTLPELDDQCTSSSLQRGELSRHIHLSTQKFPLSKDDIGFSFSVKDVATENFRKNLVISDYGTYSPPIDAGSSQSFKNGLLPEHRSSSSGSAVGSSNYHCDNPIPYMRSQENITHVRGHYLQASELDGSLSSNGLLPSQKTSDWTGPPLSFSSSLNSVPPGSQKMFDNDRPYCASRSSLLLHSSSPLSGSLRENPLLTNACRDPLRYAEHKGSSNDWEPSVPFRPSFLVTPVTASSLGTLYDPLRDSIDLPTPGYRIPFKFSFISLGTASLHAPHQSGCSDDKHNIPFNSSFCENMVEKSCYTPEKDKYATGAATGGSCVVNGKKGTIAKEENVSSTGQSKDVPNTSKVDVDCDSRNQGDGPKCKREFKVDRCGQSNEIEVEQKTDRESRVQRHFRAALVDFIKELLKPTWRMGHLSKDGHNTIVKKAVEKVLSTLQPHQIPTTVDSTKQYLSSSQRKIAKLVEAYCTKYGKS